MSPSYENSIWPESLYHIKRTIIDLAEDPSGATETTDILNTFTELPAAKKAASSALASEGYIADDFEIFDVKDNAAEAKWKHNDDVLVYAKAPRGQIFEVRLDVKKNTEKFIGNEEDKVEEFLHYVLQTTINYNNDAGGAVRATEVEGTYPSRKEAFEASKTTLLDGEITKTSFAEYDEKDAFQGEWPYGDDCVVHAVGQSGENILVLVKAQPHNHQNHACKHHGGKKCLCNCDSKEVGCKGKSCKHEDCDCK